MKLYEALCLFVKRMEENEHIQPLLPIEEKVIVFRSEHESCSLHFSKNGTFVSENTIGHLLLSAKEEELLAVVKGHTRLQQLIRRGEIEIKGTYRNVLLAESVFYICKPFQLGA
ncbi:hypothetical protein [Bacillus sp. 165]|uniref:hypothetical protein n=1 Tax=Bacillus sp. 165 TaxID=1529117 RepID=UPI001ADC320B|nr:hypothetical protein [Bacillus sp. 165]MBO9130731.1 hypothetical protein [Bacillus sp. 165]